MSGILRQPSTYFGLVGDGKSDETKGLANLVDALASSDVVELQDSPHILLGEPLTFSNLAYTTLTTARDPNMERLERAPMFLWDGEKGGTMVALDRCRQFVLEGFAVRTDDPHRVMAPAGIGILMDGDEHTDPNEPNAFGSTNTLSRLRHLTFPGPLDVEATFIANALTATENQEKHRILRCSGNGNGRGMFYHQGPSYNAKDIRIYDSPNIDCYQRAIQMDNGSVKLSHLNMSNNGWDIWAGASTGYVVEEYHLGEASIHHAFVNCPFVSRYGTFDNTMNRPRTETPAGLPTYTDEPGPWENAWILFGGKCVDVEISRFALGPPRSADTKVFGWQGDRSYARYEIGPGWIDHSHTLRTLGLDQPTLNRILGRPKIVLHNRTGDANPNGPGVLDLPSGELRFNDYSATTCIGPNFPPRLS